MTKNIFRGALVAVALTISSPAAAATTITFSGNNAGTTGNIRSFSNGALALQASAWSYDGSTLEKAALGIWGNGLGVDNNSESGGNSHAVDNSGQRDFILLIFNQSVNIASAVLHPYQQVWSSPADNDADVSYANVAGLFTTPATSLGTGNPLFQTLSSNLWSVSGNNASPYNTSLQSSGKFGNVWLIGARTGSVYPDGFKLSSISVTPAVPEPGTWAMMLIGFGAVGVAMRRRKPLVIPQAA